MIGTDMKKMRTLYVLQILLEETDKDHPLTMERLKELLMHRYGIDADRKTIYRDFELISAYGQEAGFVFESIKGSNPGYKITKRRFDLAELKLLVDAVQASKFVTSSKSEELIAKLQTLAGREEAKQLRRQVYIYDRPKTANETIFNNVDTIHEALAGNFQISFEYYEWQVDKKLHRKKKNDGYEYVVSPWALIWDDENYYLLSYSMADQQQRNYRVDKMKNIRIRDEKRVHNELFDGNLALFSKKTFGMFNGQDMRVTLQGKNDLSGAILDRFGSDIMMIRVGDDEFKVPLNVTVSQQFFGWLTGLGSDIRIVSPPQVREAYQAHLRKIMSGYEG